jgi:hypothetical protein
MRIFLICPVRGITPEEKAATEKYVSELESASNIVHWPPRNTDQNDPIGLRICQDNRQAIVDATEVHVWWNGQSQGSLFDLGMAFALNKKIILANPHEVHHSPEKCFGNVLRMLALQR